MNDVLGTPLPIAAAPMAGGPTTVALSAAVARAGGFPFLAAGYKTVEAMADEVEALRRQAPSFGVNLFVPQRWPVDQQAVADYAGELAPWAADFGVEATPPTGSDDDFFTEKVAHLVAHPVPVISFTFGLPGADVVRALQLVGSRVFATVTSPDEAVAAAGVGADALVVQGPGAGGHSAVFDPHAWPPPNETVDVLRAIGRVTDLPLIAAGGIDGPTAVRALLDQGAAAVSVGTLLLRCDEAGTNTVHRAALARTDWADTVMTRAFTGRPARSLPNRFATTFATSAPAAYPEVHHLTRPLRQAALRRGDAEFVHLWAGAGYRHATTGPAGEVIARLANNL
ncbi:NAD(P)H-dependent flavin oxidoreductase [Propionibacteriaceae bacterium G1746]|uniref:NAD(P)H-dependent flavin oxidoreductase n=1 Tax=Aestuariimicrobium sp. G57 TaxID=3418485 RepID=UPI003C27A1E4